MTATNDANLQVREIRIDHAAHTVELYTLEEELVARFPIDPYRVTVETAVSKPMDMKVPTRDLSYYDVPTKNQSR
jgi:predicted metal-dependent TIM-barrel fold hydrolase